MVRNPALTPATPVLVSPGESAAPHHAAVWLHAGGQWRRGQIIEWVRQIDRDGWDYVIMADEPVSGPPWLGRYAFNPPEHPRPGHRPATG